MQTILINAETSAAPERTHKVKRSDLEIQNGAGRQNRVSMNMCSCLHETHFFFFVTNWKTGVLRYKAPVFNL